MKKKENTRCPCGSGKMLDDCCYPYILGMATAPTAEALMRSRYSAYALGEEQYLLDSWHASTRPRGIDTDPAVKWIRLKVLQAAIDSDQVEFVATFRLNGKAHKLREISRFILEDGKWFYLDAEK